jgi:hypothetical protein
MVVPFAAAFSLAAKQGQEALPSNWQGSICSKAVFELSSKSGAAADGFPKVFWFLPFKKEAKAGKHRAEEGESCSKATASFPINRRKPK